MYTYIIDIYSFQNGLRRSSDSTSFYFKSKIVVINYKNMFFQLQGPFSQNVNFWEASKFFLFLYFPVNSIFSVVIRIYKIHVFNEAFFLFATFVMITEKVNFTVFMTILVMETYSINTIMLFIQPNYPWTNRVKQKNCFKGLSSNPKFSWRRLIVHNQYMN